MADYGVQSTQLNEAQGRGTSPVAPVEERVVNLGLPPILNSIGDIFADGMKGYGKEKAKQQEEAVVGGYLEKVDKLIQARDNGSLPTTRVDAELKALWSKTLVANPAYVEKLTQARQSMFGGSQAGQVEKEMDSAFKLREADKQAASASGYQFYAGMSVDAEDAAIKANKTARRMEDEFTRTEARAQAERARNGEKRAQGTYDRSVQDHIDKENASAGLRQVADTNFDFVSLSATDLINKVKAGMPIEEAQALHKSNIFRVRSALNAIAGTNPELASPWIKLFDDMDSNITQRMDPKNLKKDQVEMLELQYKEIITKAKLAAIQSSPEMAKAITATSLFPGENIVTMANVPVVKEYMLGTNPAAKVVGTPNDKVAFEVVKKALDNLSTGNVADKEKATIEATNLVNKMLKDTADLQGSVDPKSLKAAAGFFASTEFGKLVAAGKVDKNTALNAQSVFHRQYEAAVKEAIVNRLGDTKGIGFGMKGDQVTFEYRGGKDNITPALAYNTMDSVGIADHMETAKRDRDKAGLNEAAAGLNQLIRLHAHLEGTTDYKKYWEEKKHLLMPTIFPDPARLKVGDVKLGKDGKKYKYIGGDFNDLANSWMELSNAKQGE